MKASLSKLRRLLCSEVPVNRAVHVITAVATLGLASAAHAQRVVIVNGERLTGAEIAALEQLNCAHIPNGRYWLDVSSGAWGYADNPLRQGYLSDECHNQRRRRSLSERGMLYRPGEILNGP